MRLRSIRGMFTVTGFLLLLLLVSLFFAPRSAAAFGLPSSAGAGPPAAGAALLLDAAEPVTGTVQLHLPAVYKEPVPVLPPILALDLGTLGGRYSAANAVNAGGQVAGFSNVSKEDNWDEGHAFRWQNGRMIDLGTLGGKNSTALAINAKGQVAGNSDVKSGDQHAFFWAKGRMADIGTLGGSWSRAVDLNAGGQVVGVSETVLGATHCFVWAAGAITDLGTLGGDSCSVRDINDRGQIVGSSTLAGGDTHAFLWEAGRMIDLSPGLPAGEGSGAVAINERGLVAGVQDVQPGACDPWGCAVLWDNGVLIDLSASGKGLNMVEALNDRDQVAGFGNYQASVFPYGNPWDAQLWEGSKLVNLGVRCGARGIGALYLNTWGQVVTSCTTGSLLWQENTLTPLLAPDSGGSSAAAIDDAGHVVGSGEHALLWNTTPAVEAQTADQVASRLPSEPRP